MKKPQKVFLKGKIISISNATKIHILSVIPTQHLGMEDVSDFASIKLTWNDEVFHVSMSVFLKHFYSIAPFSLSTRRFGPPSLLKQTQGSRFKEFYLK